MRIINAVLVRLACLVPTLFGLVIVVFFIAYYVPSNPGAAIAGPYADQEQIAKINEKYGFDKPVPVQLWRYLNRLVQGDLGESLYTHREISKELIGRFPATLEMVAFSMFFTIVLGIPIGVISAIKRNTWFDHVLRAVTISGIALAVFWIGIEFQFIFGYKAQLFPVSGRIQGPAPHEITGFFTIDSLLTGDHSAFWRSLQNLVLPVLTLGIGPCATIIRFTRAGVLNTMNSDYVLYEKAMGFRRQVLIFQYVLRNAMSSTIPQIGLLFGFMLASGFVVERVFGWPGLGAFAVESILMMDYNAVLGAAIWTGVAYSIGSLLADILLIVVDPRVA
jgi:peptide/nickel transport system permease protein